MKKLLLLCSCMIVLIIGSCKKIDVGYLLTDNAQYANSFDVFITPDPIADAVRIKYEAPWIGKPISGVLGTAPILFNVADIASSDGDAAIMKSELTVNGSGICTLPYKMKSPAGTYKISLKINNEGYTAVKKEILTIVVKNNR